MPGRTTIGAVSGLAAGITLTVAGVDEISTDDLPGLLMLIAVRLFPVILVTVISLATLHQWIAAHEERTRREIEHLAESRRLLGEEFARRAAELREREELLNRHSELNQGQYRTLVDQLREARAERDEAVAERDQLRTDFDALAAEYNGMILGEVDERAAQFTRPRRPRPGGSRDRHRERGTPDPPTVSCIGRQTQPEPDHARPAEG
jgi:cell division protein FtsL